MPGKFKGTYCDLLAIAADDLRIGFKAVDGMEDAEALLRKVAADAVARFDNPIDLFNSHPQTLEHDFGSLTFEHGDTVGDAIRRLAESMIREETYYAMYECLWDSFENGAYAAALDCIETVEQLVGNDVGLSRYELKTVDACHRALYEDGRVDQAAWAVLQGGLNGARELLSGRMGTDGVLIIAEIGGVEKLQATARDLSKLTYLLAEDREEFVEKMAAFWEASVTAENPDSVPSL